MSTIIGDLCKDHDVSDEARNERGQWTAGGDSSASPKPRRAKTLTVEHKAFLRDILQQQASGSRSQVNSRGFSSAIKQSAQKRLDKINEILAHLSDD